ncbi:MAG TPA: 8-amino-7-oxononanoate synthase [Xanthomonadales bacterium]|nr:8-amino-7-oxononanoate synthase [Xanthomonadales bacterium]
MPARPDLLARLAERVAAREAEHGLRRLRTALRGEGARIVLDGRELLDFAGNDYLGLANHAAVRAALVECAARAGVGATAAHLLGGHRPEHEALEREIAEFLGRERALLFCSGYAANLGVMQALLGPGDLCVQDKLDHASLLDGARLANCEAKRYPHGDADGARRQLEARPGAAALLASDGVFSMDGDVAPLAALAAVARDTGATLMVDDAHAVGVLGAQGRGSVEHARLSPAEVPVHVVTLGKALGAAGALVAGSAALVDGLVQFARTFVYSTAMPPALAAAAHAALRVARHEDWRRDRLQRLVAHFRRGAARRGIALSPSTTPIQPLPVGDADRAVRISRALEAAGFYVPAIRAPTVPPGQARLRITLSAGHTETDVEALLDALGVALAADRDPDATDATPAPAPPSQAKRAPRSSPRGNARRRR